MSRWEIVGLSLNDVIGSGIYLLPAAAAAYLGAASLLAIALATLLIGLVVLCFAEASSRFDRAGSAYLYTREAFGDFVGFEVGWMSWLTRVAAVASLSAGFAQALAYLTPAVDSGPWRSVAVGGSLVGLTAINVVGVKAGVRTAVALVVGKIVPLVIFVAAGVFWLSGETLRRQIPTEEGGLGAAALVLLFAFAGFENTPVLAGEYEDPRRDVPFALLVQLAIVGALYVAVQAVCLGVLPDLARSTTPLADAAASVLGGWGGWLLTVGAVISILGTQSNSVLAGPRYLFAMADDGLLPPGLARVHRRFRTPAVAIVVQTLIALPLALTGGFVELAALSVVARLTTYAGTAAAVPVLRRRAAVVDGSEASFRIPGGVVVPVAAVLLSVALGASASRRNLTAAAIALAAGALIYLWQRRRVRRS